MMRHYLVIDFECMQPHQWQSVGVILYRMDTSGYGTLVRKFHTACNRNVEKMHGATKKFWKRNKLAFAYNINIGAMRDPCVEEKRLCRFIEDVKKDFPRFFLISDNPSYDIGMMNALLLRHGFETMSNRAPGIYLQPICVWTFKRTLACLGMRTSMTDKVEIKKKTDIIVAHTPIYDCLCILNEYLCLLETMNGC